MKLFAYVVEKVESLLKSKAASSVSSANTSSTVMGSRLGFDVAFDRVLGHEGDYSNALSDPGGETRWGISKRSYPNEDIKTLTVERAKEIYRRDFWNKIYADRLPDGVAFQLFDFAVNSGIETGIRLYQRALGVADDGHFGPVSMKAALEMSESDQIKRLLAERIEFMTKLSNWPNASRGWMRRIASNLRYGALDS